MPERMLRIAAMAFGAGVLAHGLDHLRQTRGIAGTPPEIVWGGTVLTVAAFATVALVLAGHRHAVRAAAVMGTVQAAAVVKAHFLPNAGFASDSYYGLGLDPLSWIAAGAELAAAILMASVALAILRARRDSGDRARAAAEPA